MGVFLMSGHRVGLAMPSAYWDRADKTVRDWKTGRPLPQYEGPCLVYHDIDGPRLVKTFLADGERRWEQMSR